MTCRLVHHVIWLVRPVHPNKLGLLHISADASFHARHVRPSLSNLCSVPNSQDADCMCLGTPIIAASNAMYKQLRQPTHGLSSEGSRFPKGLPDAIQRALGRGIHSSNALHSPVVPAQHDFCQLRGLTWDVRRATHDQAPFQAVPDSSQMPAVSAHDPGAATPALPGSMSTDRKEATSHFSLTLYCMERQRELPEPRSSLQMRLNKLMHVPQDRPRGTPKVPDNHQRLAQLCQDLHVCEKLGSAVSLELVHRGLDGDPATQIALGKGALQATRAILPALFLTLKETSWQRVGTKGFYVAVASSLAHLSTSNPLLSWPMHVLPNVAPDDGSALVHALLQPLHSHEIRKFVKHCSWKLNKMWLADYRKLLKKTPVDEAAALKQLGKIRAGMKSLALCPATGEASSHRSATLCQGAYTSPSMPNLPCSL
jgi:hypothetical protein